MMKWFLNLLCLITRRATLTYVICATTALNGLAQTPTLTTTNPAPAIAEVFGYSVAVVGNSFVVGDPQRSASDQYSGAAYLYSSNGVLMRTFLNPAPANGYFFGWTMAAVGNDKVLIGAPLGATPGAAQPGAAYLFNTNGTLLRTYLLPTAQASAQFGVSVAAIGSDRVLIGASRDNRAGTAAGATYLFGTNGALLATFTNPVPANFEFFGAAVAALGSDRLLIGSSSTPGAAFLFRTNGVLLAKFNNPIPDSGGTFGQTLATVGNDLIAIGAPGANIMAAGAGAVYLFRTNGVLFGPALENPDATENDAFGKALTAIGPDKLLVGSFNQAAGQNAGAAYLFGTNGALLMIIRDPGPVGSDFFGSTLAAIGTERALVGAPFKQSAGAAYVYELQPAFDISRTLTNTVILSWPSPWNGWTLQRNIDLKSTTWSSTGDTVNNDGTNKFIVINPSAGNSYYRLMKP